MNIMISGLIITAIGMGLVFAAIVALWGLMAFMVGLDGKITPAEEKQSEPEESGDKAEEPSDSRKMQAAAAALAFALADRETRDAAVAPAYTSLPGVWKSVQQAQVLQEKSRLFAHRTSRRS